MTMQLDDTTAAVESAKLIGPFVASVQSVFQTMLATQIEFGEVSLKSNPAPTHDVSSVIGFSGELLGSVVVSYGRETALKVACKLAGATMEATSPDFADAIGEMANMIVGGAKRALDLEANISLPTVIVGSGHTIARLSDVPCIVIPCMTALGDFVLEVSVKRVAPRKTT